jgi:hypothetical protein
LGRLLPFRRGLVALLGRVASLVLACILVWILLSFQIVCLLPRWIQVYQRQALLQSHPLPIREAFAVGV